MPSGKVHVVAGALAGGVLMYNCGGPPVMILAGALGGLLPDVDHKNSTLGRWGLWWLIFKHRGFTHSLICWLLVSTLAAMFLDVYWTIGISGGYLSHLTLDFRVPWLWPKRKKKKRR